MQASRTAHYAWLYRGGARGQAQGWPSEVASKPSATAPESRISVNALRQRVSTHSRQPAARSCALGNEHPIVEASMTAAAARAHFVDAQITHAVESGIEQLVWLGPRQTQSAQPSGLRIEVEVFRLEADTLGRGARALLDRSLVRSARTLFVCDGLLDRTPSAQIQAILRTIGDSCFGSRLAFVYLDSGSVSSHVSSSGSQKPRCAVPRLGEPTHPGLLGVEKRALPALLAGAGLVLDADIGLSEYARRALGDAPSDLRGYSCWRLALAHVRAPAQQAAASAPLN
jgi:O-methyltransferase involved in polyketide biosynthesis